MTPRWALGRPAACIALLATLAAGSAGCSGGSSFNRGSVTGCFRALPTAKAALHDDRARLLGVHLLPADRLPARVRPAVPTEDDAAVCAVAFSGDFRAGQVAGARRDASGRYAVVLVDAKHPALVGSFVGDSIPRALRGHLVP